MRLKQHEDLHTFVFQNLDGTRTLYVMDEDVKYIDANGETIDKDISLVSKTKGFGIVQNEVDLLIPNSVQNGIDVAYDGYSIKLTPQGLVTRASAKKEDNSIVYEGAFGTNTSLKYTPLLSGIKEDIILSSYMPNVSYTFVLETDGLRVRQNEGRYYLVDPAKKDPVFYLGEILVYDAIGKPDIGTMTVTTVEEGQKYLLTIAVDDEFLSDPTTEYPVTIDPSITISDSTTTGSIEDAPIFQNYPNTNFGTYAYNRVGTPSAAYGVGRTVVRLRGLMDSSEYQNISANQIVAAYFYVTEASGGAPQTVELYPLINGNWTESNATWTKLPDYSDKFACSAALSYNREAAFDITSLVQAWKSSSSILSEQEGFVLKHSNESLNKAICSSISGTTIYQNQLHEGNSQKWTFTDVGDGYYTIRTNYSSALYYLGVISDSTALDVDVGLRSGALTDGMKWKIGITEVGAYKLIPKTGEANGYVLAAKVSDGAKLIQGAYVDNNTYRDEWMICKISYSSHIIHYYDEGFEVLFGNFNQDPEKIIRKYHNEVNKMLMGAFGLHLSFEICSYTSEADDCKKEQYENITFERLVGDCPHSFSESHSLTTLGMRNGTSNGNITTSVVVWTGHILPGNPPSESKDGPKYGVVMTPQHLINAEGNYQDMTLLEIEKKYVEILLHELSHQVGAEDHGCYGQINKNPCSNTFCDICYGESGVLRSCVMGNRTNFWGETDDSRYCSECKNIIRSHLENHHNIWDTW